MGFFMGMPFPLGVLEISRKPQGTIAWAWAMNAVFTVAGGLASVLLSLMYGFKITLIVALTLYFFAFITFSRIHAENASH